MPTRVASSFGTQGFGTQTDACSFVSCFLFLLSLATGAALTVLVLGLFGLYFSREADRSFAASSCIVTAREEKMSRSILAREGASLWTVNVEALNVTARVIEGPLLNKHEWIQEFDEEEYAEFGEDERPPRPPPRVAAPAPAPSRAPTGNPTRAPTPDSNSTRPNEFCITGPSGEEECYHRIYCFYEEESLRVVWSLEKIREYSMKLTLWSSGFVIALCSVGCATSLLYKSKRRRGRASFLPAPFASDQESRYGSTDRPPNRNNFRRPSARNSVPLCGVFFVPTILCILIFPPFLLLREDFTPYELFPRAYSVASFVILLLLLLSLLGRANSEANKGLRSLEAMDIDKVLGPDAKLPYEIGNDAASAANIDMAFRNDVMRLSRAGGLGWDEIVNEPNSRTRDEIVQSPKSSPSNSPVPKADGMAGESETAPQNESTVPTDSRQESRDGSSSKFRPIPN